MHRNLTCIAVIALFCLTLSCVTDQDLPSAQKCHVYLVIPPEHEDELASDEVADAWLTEWLNGTHHELQACDRVIPESDAKPALRFVGVSNVKDNLASSISTGQVTHLAERTGATHLIFITYQVNKNQLKLRSQVYSAKPWHHLRSDRMATQSVVPLAKNTRLREGLPTRWLAYSVSLLPNAVEGGYSAVNVINLRPLVDKNVQSVSQTSHSILPPFISSVATDSIRHPEEFGTWGAAFDIKGTVSLLSIDESYVFQVGPPGNKQTKNYGLGLVMLVPSVNAVLSGHSPLGTSSFGVGGGIGLYNYRDTENDAGTGPIPILRLFFAQTMFMSERWFVRLATTYYFTPSPLRPIVSTDVFTFGYVVEGLFAVGFYYPEARSSARSLSL